MLKESQKGQVRKVLDSLEEEVELALFVRKGSKECEMQQGLMEELLPLGNLGLEIHELGSPRAEEYGVERAPVMLFKGRPGIRFWGLTSGHEFRTLLDTIVMVGSDDSGLGDSTREKLGAVEQEVELLVFATPTCPYCPMASIMANRFAMENDKFTSITVEAQEFPELAQKHTVMSVPKVVINRKGSFVGGLPEGQFVDKVLEAL